MRTVSEDNVMYATAHVEPHGRAPNGSMSCHLDIYDTPLYKQRIGTGVLRVPSLNVQLSADSFFYEVYGNATLTTNITGERVYLPVGMKTMTTLVSPDEAELRCLQ